MENFLVEGVSQLTQLLKAVMGLLMVLLDWIWRRARLVYLGSKFKGPLAMPLIGNLYLIYNINFPDIHRVVEKYVAKYGPQGRFYVGPLLIIGTIHAQDVEMVLSGRISKSFIYKFLEPWLGTGLLISTGDKWRARRKALTPAFHFRILEQFVTVFQSCSDELVKQLRLHVGGGYFDVCPLVELFTLDVICETAMGVKINALADRRSPYVHAVKEISTIVIKRFLQPFMFFDFVFYRTLSGRRFKKCLEVLHDLSSRVITERREELLNLCMNQGKDVDIDDIGRRRRVAFLDLLLLAARDGGLSDADIREEVDTFMFEGHDTTAAAVSFTIYLLSRYEDAQEKVYEELKSIFDPTQPLQPSMEQLSELKYMEMVIKESLRLYPPVTHIFRDVTEEEKLPSTGLIMPAGALLIVSPWGVNRNPEVFPDPLKFDPERFTPEESARRHPYAYIPFSAGPRNCIGQRFAMLELKSVLAKILWNFRIITEPGFEPIEAWEIVMKSANGIRIKLEER